MEKVVAEEFWNVESCYSYLSNDMILFKVSINSGTSSETSSLSTDVPELELMRKIN